MTNSSKNLCIDLLRISEFAGYLFDSNLLARLGAAHKSFEKLPVRFFQKPDHLVGSKNSP